ncbi:MAG TPA: helix-turn-helix domain-containing protein [Nocardioides sp.]|uniref:PucR family transcriptional regulator n=1 Tax=Nocardioides sp. TaxID=35761 RepID=UPI002E3393D5|nr:helix-turn-helix domain-containing protein [Nocardioides sp.]HEX5087648.1 helix-turn-helix domain-containing protein [Nocardioides sp.]
MTVTDVDRDRLESALLARLPGLLDEVSAGLATNWPDYSEFLATDRTGVVEAAGIFVRWLAELSGQPPQGSPGPDGRGIGPEDPTVQLVFEQIGRREMRAGNDLTRLLTAFQLGARVAWRHVSATGLELGLRPESLATLADAVFGFVNQLSFAAARGYLAAQLDDARALERNREALADLLLSGRAGTPATRAAAVRAGWAIPDRLAIAVVDPDDEAARRIVDHLGAEVLPIRKKQLHGAVVPYDGSAADREHLRRELRGARAVVGYPVAPDALPRTVEVTRTALELHGAGLLHGDPAFVDQHLDTIIVWRDQAVTNVLREQVLAPLDEVSPGVRDRLVTTLRSWLHHQGDVQAVAEELSIHPQTVRYRLGQLREHFGDALDSPRDRARLFLVLGWPLPR